MGFLDLTQGFFGEKTLSEDVKHPFFLEGACMLVKLPCIWVRFEEFLQFKKNQWGCGDLATWDAKKTEIVGGEPGVTMVGHLCMTCTTSDTIPMEIYAQPSFFAWKMRWLLWVHREKEDIKT